MQLDHDTITQLKRLFGTVRHAHEALGLQIDVPYMTFYRAMQFTEITAQQKETIVRRWMKWRAYYLNPDCPMDDPMQLNPMDEDLEPEWHAPKKKSSSRTRSRAE